MPDNLRSRHKFLEAQASAARARLKKYIEECKPQLNNAEETLHEISHPNIELDAYVQYKCTEFQRYCNDQAMTYMNELIHTSKSIDISFLKNILRTQYILEAFSNCITPVSPTIQILLDINSGNISAPKSKNILQMKYPDIVPVEFITRRFHHIERLFKRPFSVSVSVEKMNEHVIANILKIFMHKITAISEMELKDLKWLNSYQYYTEIGYAQILNDEEEDAVKRANGHLLIKEALKGMPEDKQLYVLNFIFNVAPCFINLLSPSEYEKHPDFYVIYWAIDMKKNKVESSAQYSRHSNVISL